MASGSEDGSKVVAVGANIEAFRAVDTKANDGKSDFQDLVFIDSNTTGRAIDGFAFASQFVERNPIFLIAETMGEFDQTHLQTFQTQLELWLSR